MNKLISKITSIVMLTVMFSHIAIASGVTSNTGADFISKSEFDNLKNDFQAQLNSYNSGIDAKIDDAIVSYLAGVVVRSTYEQMTQTNFTYPLCFKYSASYNATYDSVWRPIWNLYGGYLNNVYFEWVPIRLNDVPNSRQTFAIVNENPTTGEIVLKEYQYGFYLQVNYPMQWYARNTLETKNYNYSYYWFNYKQRDAYKDFGTAASTVTFDTAGLINTAEYWQTNKNYESNSILYVNDLKIDKDTTYTAANLPTISWENAVVKAASDGKIQKNTTPGTYAIATREFTVGSTVKSYSHPDIIITGNSGSAKDILYQNNTGYIYTGFYDEDTREVFLRLARKSEWGRVNNSAPTFPYTFTPKKYSNDSIPLTYTTIADKSINAIVDPGFLITNSSYGASSMGYSSYKSSEIKSQFSDTADGTEIKAPLNGGLYLFTSTDAGKISMEIKLRTGTSGKNRTLIFGNSSLEDNIGRKQFTPSGTSSLVTTATLPYNTTNYKCSMHVNKGEKIWLKITSTEDVYLESPPICNMETDPR